MSRCRAKSDATRWTRDAMTARAGVGAARIKDRARADAIAEPSSWCARRECERPEEFDERPDE
jgi:hypothetical protein